MRCPFCSSDDTQVVDTRSNEDTNVIRRRRKCPKCDKRFTTYERVELRMPRLVKKGGSRTDFDRNKLVGSMTLALRKLDKIAYIRFASVYRSFESPDDFRDAVQEVAKPKKRRK
jgi:transcriptional repressor NrdR